ncbi:hypothetical protein BN381_110045 [Candidatus Microthrix parvicella RN1]|uniref:Uncharacterized protein n=1 Tax=Candidatus Neomicrothrix parvicella RN1 TaxID=1229780 RepID=R4YW86_9ACTN|nr:hypothetical protein BN381_110045 [Candidatus Microthrix parvicella RN1]
MPNAPLPGVDLVTLSEHSLTQTLRDVTVHICSPKPDPPSVGPPMRWPARCPWTRTSP